ncbi:MAG: Nif3-like dinuclear metal center hexameric protein, partial [Slackia sp.]|nr:Nif3-like dinuclear metal center hexameric protein [Slackia sp.]
MEQRYEGADGACRPTDSTQLRTTLRSSLAMRCESAPETIGALVGVLSEMFRPCDAEPWDRTGLLVGDAAAPLAGVACALDPTLDAIERAEACGANVLLTHHPAFLD